MKLSDLTFEQITSFDPFSSHADSSGYRKEWVARNTYGIAVAFGDTKKECLQDARFYVKRRNAKPEGDPWY